MESSPRARGCLNIEMSFFFLGSRVAFRPDPAGVEEQPFEGLGERLEDQGAT